MTTAAPKDPALNVGTISLNDCRTVCRALKLRAAELKKAGKKLRELDRPTEATSEKGKGRDLFEMQARDRAEEERNRINKGGR